MLLVLRVGVLRVALGEAGLQEQAVLGYQGGQDAGGLKFVVHVGRNVERVGAAACQVRIRAANHGEQEARVEVGAVAVMRHVRVALYGFDRFEVGRRREHHVVLEPGEVGGGGVLEAHGHS